MTGSHIDRIILALSSAQCCSVCRFLADETDDVTTLQELTTHVVTEELSDGEHRLADADYRHAAIELHHVHLPKLADADVIEYAPDRGIVRAGSALPIALELLGSEALEDGTMDVPTLR